MMIVWVWIARKIGRFAVHFSRTMMMIWLHCISLYASVLPIDSFEHRRGFTHTWKSQLKLSPLAPTHHPPPSQQQQAFVRSRHDSNCRLLSTQHPSRCSLYWRDSVLRVRTYSFKHLCSSLSIALWTFLGPASSISSSSKKKERKKHYKANICKLHLLYKNIHCCCFMCTHALADVFEKEPKEGLVWKIKII